MTAYEELWDAQRIIEKHWRHDQPQEQALILGFARDALNFISVTGQRHRFHDYRQHSPSGTVQDPGGLLQRTERFFTELLEAHQPPDEAELTRVVIDALHFIAATGQLASMEEYVRHLDAGAPPYVVAAFGSLEEAEAWLMNHPDPPDFAHVIVAGEYRSVYYQRKRNIRKLPNDNAIEYYLAELQKEEPPIAQLSFATREEAEAWLKTQPEPARREWVSISGELYLAAYYPNIKHRALFTLSMAEGYHV
jgi:hypothetical protein